MIRRWVACGMLLVIMSGCAVVRMPVEALAIVNATPLPQGGQRTAVNVVPWPFEPIVARAEIHTKQSQDEATEFMRRELISRGWLDLGSGEYTRGVRWVNYEALSVKATTDVDGQTTILECRLITQYALDAPFYLLFGCIYQAGQAEGPGRILLIPAAGVLLLL